MCVHAYVHGACDGGEEMFVVKVCVCVVAPGRVHVFDRNGDQVDEFSLGQTGPCLALDWDKDGEVSVPVGGCRCVCVNCRRSL